MTSTPEILPLFDSAYDTLLLRAVTRRRNRLTTCSRKTSSSRPSALGPHPSYSCGRTGPCASASIIVKSKSRFKVMPFGLCNAPTTFQRLMDSVLAGLQWSSCLVYLDDIVIPGKSFKIHLQNLRKFLERLRQAGLRLHPNKCAFCCKQVAFLGHIVSEEGVATNPSKTVKVATWPEPKTPHEVRQFLGLASYYRRFIKDFATIAKPLHRLTEKTADFKWTPDCLLNSRPPTRLRPHPFLP